jgi:lipopolysaccharide biosynthesis protein
MDKVKTIAFYLPQYHPIPENDEWWGKGFTEWRNVTQALPQFTGHYQPHLPADLGFYDLRLPEARQAQTDLAKAYGIHGFCYYHYWFNGRRILERPFNEVLSSGKPDFPFCLCWANENWTRSWDGNDREILLEQIYSEEDDRQQMQWLANAFQDPRYIRIDGKPLFMVYRTSKLINPERTAETWRAEAHRLGIGDIFLCKVESFHSEHGDPVAIGFDAAVEFQPDWSQLGQPLQRRRRWELARKLRLAEAAYVENNIFDYSDLVEKMLAKPSPGYKRFPCVTPSWDNTARRKNGAYILRNATPKAYEHWMRSILEKTLIQDTQEKIVFINAWNEWAEGNHLEPCQEWGHAYLEATRRALLDNESTTNSDHKHHEILVPRA